MVRPILLASFAAILPGIAQAQGRAMMPAAAHPMAAVPRVVTHMAQPHLAQVPQAQTAMTHPGPVGRIVVRSNAPRLRTAGAPAVRVTTRPHGTRRHINANVANVANGQQLKPGCSAVPGLGFDFSHLAAVCGPEAASAGLQANQVFFPSFGGGFFVPSVPVIVEEAAAEPEQAEAAEAEVAEAPRRARAVQPAPAPEVETASVAPRQQDEFVFVRRDGTVFFAVAYAWENGTLRYVTSEGLRRSLASAALDLDATQQFNEQRGMNFRSPA